MSQISLTVEPDLQPIYPTPSQLAHLLSPNVGLSPSQKVDLVSHCLTRACVFGDFTLISYLLSEPQAQPHIDLGKQDEDGLGLISITILGFGCGGDRDVEREECVRLLVAEGADVNLPDNGAPLITLKKGTYSLIRLYITAGWIGLHHAALLAPPTLVSHLITRGCSTLAVTRRGLTALDIVTAHSPLPGRHDVRLLLEEAMREQGWTGGRVEEQRRAQERHDSKLQKRRALQEHLTRMLDIDYRWWGDIDAEVTLSEVSNDEDDDLEQLELFVSSHLDISIGQAKQRNRKTPSPDYTSMLVFAPHALPNIFQTLIVDFRPTLLNTEPANALYMLSRFACLNCNDGWLEDLIIGATDAIEDTFFVRYARPPLCLFLTKAMTEPWG